MVFQIDAISQLSRVETEIVRIDVAAGRDQPPVTWKSRWRNFGSLWEKALDLQTVFRADLAGARKALAKSPRPVLEVSGDVDLFGGDERVMQFAHQAGHRTAADSFSGRPTD